MFVNGRCLGIAFAFFECFQKWKGGKKIYMVHCVANKCILNIIYGDNFLEVYVVNSNYINSGDFLHTVMSCHAFCI